MKVEIRRGEWKAFFQAPLEAYGSDSPFVSVFDSDLKRWLDTKRNPLFRTGANGLELFTAHRSGRVIGRIAAHSHQESNIAHGWNRASFGYFDCIDEEATANALLAAAESWGRSRGHAEIWGNFNLTAMQQMGVVTDGFDRRPYSDQVWNPPHIPKHLERSGYAREFPMTSFEVPVSTAAAASMALRRDQRDLMASGRYRFSAFRSRRVRSHFPALVDVLNDGFARNPLFVPLSQAEFDFQAQDLAWVIDPRISWLAYEGNTLVGAIILIPDLNPVLRRCRSRLGLPAIWRLLRYRGRAERAVVVFQSTRSHLQHQGIGAILIQLAFQATAQAGYRSLGITWVGDGNAASLAGVRRAGGEPLHRLHLYRKALA